MEQLLTRIFMIIYHYDDSIDQQVYQNSQKVETDELHNLPESKVNNLESCLFRERQGARERQRETERERVLTERDRERQS